MSDLFLPNLISATRLTHKNSPLNHQSYGKRIAKYFELELITEGSGAVITDQHILQTLPERLFIRKPGMQLEGFSPYFSYFIVFSDESRQLEHLELPLYVDGMGQLAGYFKTIRNNFIYPDHASDFEIKACIFKILSSIIRQADSKNIETTSDSIQYIKSHLSEPLPVSALAKASGYSLNHYINLFKTASGETPSCFIRRCRVQKACELLEETNDTIEHISLRCGFPNLSYFFRSFKKIQGETPHEYRKKIRIYKE